MAGIVDTETGLPELPEGHFWRVSEKIIRYEQDQLSGKYHTKLTPARLSIFKVIPPGDWGNWENWSQSYLNFSSHEHETRTEKKKFLFLTRRVTESRVRVKASERLVLFLDLPDRFDEEHIRLKAQTLIEDFEFKTTQTALLGDYPPKKLGI